MKRLLLIFLILFLPLASAIKVNILENQSYSKDGRNITLLDTSKDKALICVNNEKAILSKNEPKIVNDVSLELKNIYEDKVRVEIKVFCKDCICGDSCSNINCLGIKKEEVKEEIKKE